MDLQEGARRVVLGHWVVIVAFVVAIGGAVSLYHVFDTPMYSASTRVQFDGPAPTSGTEALAVADTGKAIVTSPGHIIAALNVAGVQRDVVKLTPRITVAPLGTSRVLLLAVTDPSANAAAGIANALADNLVATRLAVVTAQRDSLDAQIKTLTDRIGAL